MISFICAFDQFIQLFFLCVLGSLIKLVYFSRHEDRVVNDKRKKSLSERLGVNNGNRRSFPILGGRLHFVKFETAKINECLDFIHSKQLHRGGVIPVTLSNLLYLVQLYVTPNCFSNMVIGVAILQLQTMTMQ